MGGEEHLALFWDDLNAVVTYAPVKKRLALTAIKARSASASAGASTSLSSAMSALVLRRDDLPEEQDTLDLRRAELEEENPVERRAAVVGRLQARRAAAERAASGTATGKEGILGGRGVPVAPVAASAAGAVAATAFPVSRGSRGGDGDDEESML